MKKKILLLLTVLVMAMVLLFVCCSNRQTEPEPEPTEYVPVIATTEPPETVPQDVGVEELPPEILNEDISATDPSETGKTDPTRETAAPDDQKQPSGSAPTSPPAETTPPQQTEPSEPEDDAFCCEYARYLALSASEQQAYSETFDSVSAFIEWCRAGEKAHEDHEEFIIVKGGNLDLGDYID